MDPKRTSPPLPPSTLRSEAEAALAAARRAATRAALDIESSPDSHADSHADTSPNASTDSTTASPEALRHELQVHQIELEMQNENLRQAMVELEQSRDRYVDLYEFAPVGYLTLTRDGRIDAINLTGAGLLGRNRKALLNQRFDRYMPADQQARWQEHFIRAWKDDCKRHCELDLARGDGTVFAASLNCLVNSNGPAASLRLALTDISERRQAEGALQESETRFRVMADSAPALIWMAGVDKGCTWFNQQWLDITGRTMAEEIGDGWAQSLHADDAERCLRAYDQAFDRRESFEIEYRLRRADGRYCWVIDHGVPRFGADREFLGYIGSCIDVSRLKLVEDDLNRAQSVGHIGSWRLDVRQNRLTWSPENYRIFELAEGTPLTYETFLSRVHPDDAAYVDTKWKAALQGEPYDIEHRLLIDGQVKWVREKAALEFESSGRMIGGFGITQDITEIKQATARLQVANARLADIASEQAAHLRQLADDLTCAEQRERDRLYELLHDDVQPLLVAARLSLSSLNPRTSAEDRLRIAADATAHISQVIQIARSLSRQLNPPLIRDRGLNEALESLCRWVKDNHGLAVDLYCAPEVTPDEVPTRLLCFRIVRELLLNVVKHAATPSATVSLELDDQERIRITVADAGTGFDPALLDRGTGLAEIARRVGMLGGSLRIDSRPGQGTVATVCVPAGRPAPDEQAAGGEQGMETRGGDA